MVYARNILGKIGGKLFMRQPLIFGNFINQRVEQDERKYIEFTDHTSLKEIMNEYLEEYIKKLNQLEEYNIHIFWTTAGKDGYKKFLEKNKWIKTLTCEYHFVKIIN